MSYTIAANNGPAIPRGTLVSISDSRLTDQPRLPVLSVHAFGQKVAGILDVRAMSGKNGPRRCSVLTAGTITGVDTSAHVVGTALYSTTGGAWSNTPLPGSQRIGQVAVQAVDGEITVSITQEGGISGITGTKAEFNTALTDGDFMFVGDGLTLASVYPIGSVYTSVVATNPNTLFGFGTWTAFAAGRVLVGLDSGDSDFDTAEETGGSKTNTPSGTVSSIAASSASSGMLAVGSAFSTSEHTHPAPTFTGNAMSVVQPYVTVYMWKRTA